MPFPGGPSGDVFDARPSIGARIIEREGADKVGQGAGDLP